jgi:hypothetical protein
MYMWLYHAETQAEHEASRRFKGELLSQMDGIANEAAQRLIHICMPVSSYRMLESRLDMCVLVLFCFVWRFVQLLTQLMQNMCIMFL